MTKIRLIRLGGLILLFWGLGAMVSWLAFTPADGLVGVRSGGGVQVPDYDFAPNDLQDSAALLSKNALWGIQRDGTVAPPKKSKEAEEKKIEWRILASVNNGKERYVVVRIDNKEQVIIKEGERLPDGSELLKISPKTLTVRTADDEQKTINLTL